MNYGQPKLPFSSFVSLSMIISFSMLLVSCGQRSASLPKPRVGPMEANHPWLIFDPTREQGIVSPQGDKQDPNVVYFVFVMRNGDTVKVNLRTKEVTPFHFNVKKWEEVDNHTVRYELGYTWENHKAPLWTEFRGKKEERSVKHLFGDPWPKQSGIRKATLRTGYYYIMDKRDDKLIELLRVKIVNSELDFGGLGSTYISPDQKWIIFVLDNQPSRTFVFNREEKVPPTFLTEHEAQVLETWN